MKQNLPIFALALSALLAIAWGPMSLRGQTASDNVEINVDLIGDDKTASPGPTQKANEKATAAPAQDAKPAAPADKPSGKAASPAATKPAEPSPHDAEARAILKNAREAIEKLRSIKTAIRETVGLGPRKVRATGRYVQGSKFKLRLEFEIKLGSEDSAATGKLLQVCDETRTLWTEMQVGTEPGDKPRVTRRNVKEILEAAEAGGRIPESVLKGELGMGGLPALLASIENAMTFTVVKDELVQDKTFRVVEGTWNAELMKNFQQVGRKSSNELPEHVPDAIQIYFDTQNGNFPRRIVYQKKLAGRNVLRPMITIDFTEIVLNGAVDEKLFEYHAPKDATPEDITSRYLELIRRASQPTAASGGLPGAPLPGGQTKQPAAPSSPESPAQF